MLRIYGCIIEQHDLRLVLLAGFICLFACFAAVNLMARARRSASTRDLAWLTAAAVVFSFGVWTTHFVAELAYMPGVPVGYHIGLTAASLAVAFVVSYLGMIVALRYRAWEIGGVILGAAVGGMHYVGMAAMRVAADFHWDVLYVLASLAIGGVFAAAAMCVLSRGTTWRYRVGATLLLVLAIVGLHFTAMTAVVLELNPLIEIPDVILDPQLLAVTVAAVTVLIVTLGLSGSIVDDHLTQNAVREAERLRASEARLRIATAEAEAASHTIEVAFRDLKAAQANLIQAEKMASLGQLTGGVAHDFNNLLTVATGSLDLILRKPGDADRVTRLVQTALTAMLRGEKLTQQLLTFARQQVSRPQTVNVNRLIAELEPFLSPAVSYGIELSLDLSSVLDPSHIDPAQFEAALLNLTINARDAMSSGGRITVETRNVELDDDYAADNTEVSPGGYIMVAVSDNGAGMSSDVAARAFEPFFTTKEVGKGSGLGLSQVYGFAKSAGGHVKIYSEPGVGTTVRLYLPRSADHVVEAPEPRSGMISLRPANGHETILVVEDNPNVLAYAVEVLSELGYRVLSAADARQALDILHGDEPIDLMFSDVVMPGGMNGVQLAVEARRARPGLKVLLTSGYAASALSGDHALPENIEMLGKPYRHSDLADKLRLVISR